MAKTKHQRGRIDIELGSVHNFLNRRFKMTGIKQISSLFYQQPAAYHPAGVTVVKVLCEFHQVHISICCVDLLLCMPASWEKESVYLRFARRAHIILMH